MKVIKYNLCTLVNRGTDEEPQMEEVFFPTEMVWNEANEEIAKREAYNGECTIVDDGQPESTNTPTTEERVEALEAAVTMLCMPDVNEV